MAKNTPKIKFGKIVGNVVVSNNQSGGITAHNTNSSADKSKSFLQKFGWWIGLFASIVTILAYFQWTPFSKTANSTLPDSLNRKPSHIPLNKKATYLNTPKTMFSKKPQHKNSDEKITFGNISGDVIISNNQTGGITAGHLHLTIPEDKDIDIEDNIVSTIISSNTIEFKPKQGTWKIPFIEILVDEKDEIDGVWLSNLFGGMTQTSFSYWNRTIDNKIQRFQRFVIAGPPASPTVPYYFKFKKQPSIMFVGDASDASKEFVNQFSQ